MAETRSARREKHVRLLVAIRDAAFDLVNTADERETYANVGIDAFRRLAAAINRAMEFEEAHGVKL
jgi:hypothetical protein